MGEHEYRLKSLADDELLVALANIVGQRNRITAAFLAYLAELDERQIFLDHRERLPTLREARVTLSGRAAHFWSSPRCRAFACSSPRLLSERHWPWNSFFQP